MRFQVAKIKGERKCKKIKTKKIFKKPSWLSIFSQYPEINLIDMRLQLIQADTIAHSEMNKETNLYRDDKFVAV